MDKKVSLLGLARERFGHLSELDEMMFSSVADGRNADFHANYECIVDANKVILVHECTIDANRIVWLCTDPKAREYLLHHGITVIGARIEGDLDLSFVTVEVPLRFIRCVFVNLLSLKQAKLQTLDLEETTVNSINAELIRVEGNVSLNNGFKAHGNVNLEGAFIGGKLYCTGGKFLGLKTSLSCDSSTVKGGVFLDKEDHAEEGFEAHGSVSFLSADIGGQFCCQGGKFHCKEHALSANNSKIVGGVFLNEAFEALGEVRLLGVSINGQLACRGGKFLGQPKALTAERATITGGVFLDEGFEAQGEVLLKGASIGSQLSCTKGKFYMQEKSLYFDGAEITGSVFLNNEFYSAGEVRFPNATISGNFVCTGGKFQTLLVDGATIKGDVHLDDKFTALGKVSFANAEIDDNLILKNITDSKKMTLDLRGARVGTLHYEKNSWTDERQLYLNGLTYKLIDESLLLDDKRKLNDNQPLEWLRLQSKEEFSLQPYEQLAEVLSTNGYEEAAIRVSIGEQDDRRDKGGLKGIKWLRNLLLSWTIGHGYRPWRSGVISLVFIFFFGVAAFTEGCKQGLISPSDPPAPSNPPTCTSASKDYSAFISPVYSLDVFLPIIDLHQEDDWLPNSEKNVPVSILGIKVNLGNWLLWYFWLHIITGWVFTSLWVAGFTGLVRGRK
jgi:hypothetical protein